MTNSCASKEWIDYIAALTPIVVALFVAYIAYRQWRIAREKLRLDLYNRRFTIFETTLRFYHELLDSENLNAPPIEATHRLFITAMIESEFLFSEKCKAHSLMTEFNKSAFVIIGSRRILKGIHVTPELLTSTSDRLIDELESLHAKIDEIKKSVSQYLAFHNITY
jgi:hypothetical protein